MALGSRWVLSAILRLLGMILKRGLPFAGVTIGSLLSATLFAQTPDQAAFRSNWLPSGGYSEGAIGDLWTFTCPPKGRVSIWVDTMDDTGNGKSTVDPAIEVVDRLGHLVALANNNASCTNFPVCANSPSPCARVLRAACGFGNPHSIVVYSTPSTICTGGGGYKLWVGTTSRLGKLTPSNAIGLGGGTVRVTPSWAQDIPRIAPALDDEGVPSFAFPGPQTFGAGSPPTSHSVTLEWDRSSTPVVSGYRIFYGTSSRLYTVIEDVGNRTSHTFTGLERGKTYFFTVAAYSGSGVESSFSNEVRHTIPDP
jgi:Fibronectin type III domain